MNTSVEPVTAGAPPFIPEGKPGKNFNAPFRYARDLLENRFVYLTISPRARGLSIGVNLNPDKECNFDCIYCEVDRSKPSAADLIDCEVAGRELEFTMALVQSGALRDRAPYSTLPPELLELKHVALSGDGEPTASPLFLQAVETVAHVRAKGIVPYFKIVLITNASHLDLPNVQEGLRLFTAQDEIWAKLEAGTQEYANLINRSSVPLEKILSNILETGKKRPIIIQSLFCSVDNHPPSAQDIEAYAHRLRELKEGGATIPLVQIYSATRPMHSKAVQHLPLKTMSEIASTVRRISGLRAEVF
jgi:wyosine [tRNA(Phe)-imidazoG37] synthetase (radical SAM superfamily)